jgi:DNA-binding transcriptional MerR regulator
MSLLAIGQVAERTGIPVSTVRYYEEIGVISTAARVGGKRRFADDTVGRVRFIRWAQEAGFSLDEIRVILDDETGVWRDLVDEKLDELIQRRDRLDGMIATLRDVRECGCGAVASCPRYRPYLSRTDP